MGLGANVGALIIRIGFWGFLVTIFVYWEPPKPCSNYLGLYTKETSKFKVGFGLGFRALGFGLGLKGLGGLRV